MEWLPEFNFGWLNGWIPLALLGLTDGILFLSIPREVVKRLFDRSGWSHQQVILTVIGKLLALVCLAFLILTPLKLDSILFPIGAFFVLLGLFGLIISIINFRDAVPDKPATTGLYKISRHPQVISSNLVIMGACIAIGSWSALLLLLLTRLFGHFGILAEEEICLDSYGEVYGQYMQEIPRYFFFF